MWEAHFKGSENISTKSVLIIGCGGTGAIIADHLARTGLGSIGLIDGATLDAPDLNRQFTFKKEDIGKSKVSLLKKHIEEQTHCKVIESYPCYLSEENLDIFKEKYDLVINCADRPKFIIQKLSIEVSNLLNCPILFGSVGINDYVVGPFCKNAEEKNTFCNQIAKEAQFFGHSQKVIKGSNALLNSRAAIDIATKAYEYLIGLTGLEFKAINL